MSEFPVSWMDSTVTAVWNCTVGNVNLWLVSDTRLSDVLSVKLLFVSGK